MAAFRRAGRERVNVFEVGGSYLFKHYFEGEAVFDRLKRYYDNQGYRFEVPPEEFDEIRSFLGEYGYGLVVVEDPEPFVVAVRQYTAHPENIFKSSVVHRAADGYNCFLLTDREAVEEALADDAMPIADVDVENPF